MNDNDKRGAAREKAIEAARDLYDELFHRDEESDEDNAFRTVLYHAYDAGYQAASEHATTRLRAMLQGSRYFRSDVMKYIEKLEGR